MPPMGAVRIEDLRKHLGETVTLQGWLYHRRSSGKLHFLEVRDGTGIVQCVVFKGNVSPETFQQADHILQESSVEVVGNVDNRMSCRFRKTPSIRGCLSALASGLPGMSAGETVS